MAYLWITLTLLIASILVTDASTSSFETTANAAALVDSMRAEMLGEALTGRLVAAIEEPSDDFENAVLHGSDDSTRFMGMDIKLRLESEAGKIALGPAGREFQDRYLRTMSVDPVDGTFSVHTGTSRDDDASVADRQLARLLAHFSNDEISRDFSRFNPLSTIDPAFASNEVLRAAGLTDGDISQLRAQGGLLGSSLGSASKLLSPGPPIFRFSVATLPRSGAPRAYSSTIALSSGGRATVVGINDVAVGNTGAN